MLRLSRQPRRREPLMIFGSGLGSGCSRIFPKFDAELPLDHDADGRVIQRGPHSRVELCRRLRTHELRTERDVGDRPGHWTAAGLSSFSFNRGTGVREAGLAAPVAWCAADTWTS